MKLHKAIAKLKKNPDLVMASNLMNIGYVRYDEDNDRLWFTDESMDFSVSYEIGPSDFDLDWRVF